MADIAASVLAKLRNKAKASGISYQQCLQLFVQEEFLRKLSKSGCEDTLILKGGLFIYTLTNFESRATIDVDFLLRGYSNTIDDVKEFRSVIENNKIALDAIDESYRNLAEEARLKNDFFTEQWAMTSGTLHSCRVDLLTQYSLLLTMVSLLEEAVNTLCRLYHNINHLDKEVKDIKGSGLERAAKYLKDVVGIDGFTADKQWEYITVIRDARNMVVHNGGRIYKEFDKYDKFKIGYREEDHQLYLEYNDIVKMYDAILDFMDRTFRIIPQG